MIKRAGLCLLVVVAVPAYAGGLGMQPGLWEVKPVKTIVDGRDNSAQLAQASASAEAALANMPPDQRAKIEAMMQQHGVSLGSSAGTLSIHVCVSPEMAKRDAPPVGKDGHCQPTVTQSGATTTFSYNCQSNGVTSSGTGHASREGDLISIVSDGTSTSAAGTHTTHTEVQMHFIGADCGATQAPASAP